MKITKDLFVWKIITHKQASVFYHLNHCHEPFPVYILHENGGKTLIDSEEILLDAYYDKSVLGIEVGEIDLHEVADNTDLLSIFWNKKDIEYCAKDMLDNELTENEISEIKYNIEQSFDAEIGINWDVIKCQIQMVIDERGEN